MFLREAHDLTDSADGTQTRCIRPTQQVGMPIWLTPYTDTYSTKRSHFIFEKGGKLIEAKLGVKPANEYVCILCTPPLSHPQAAKTHETQYLLPW
jgi:hypothetical protein